MADLRRARARLRTQRLERELAGPLWDRMVRIRPVAFRLEGGRAPGGPLYAAEVRFRCGPRGR
jgi:hypothetical protein